MTAVGHDPRDPDPWRVLELQAGDRFAPEAVRCMVRDQKRACRRFALPLVRIGLIPVFWLFRLIRFVVPGALNGNGLLHAILVAGLRTFVTPEANRLILRHLRIGTEVLAFLAANGGVELRAVRPLRPRAIGDLRADMLLIHDLNVFNFLIEWEEQRRGQNLARPERLDLSMIGEAFDIAPLPDGWLNRVDLETAAEVYNVLYALLLPKRAFERASHSLQFDEDFARIAGVLIGQPGLEAMASNNRPALPLPTTGTARRVLVHGLEAEALHWRLVQLKRAQG